MLRCSRLLLLAALTLLGSTGPLRADAPFFQAFQAPTPTLASPYSVAPAGSPYTVGTPLPAITETDAPLVPYQGPGYAPGVVSSTIIDQPAAPSMTPMTAGQIPGQGPVPLNIFDSSTWFATDGSFLMPWDLGPAACNDCRPCGIMFFHNYSSWRGISEGTGANNNGFSYGLNYGTRLGPISDYTGIGAQIGASYGLYDLNGRSSGFRDKEIQQQTFLTVGLFRAADKITNFSFGVVWDGMFNTNFSQYAVSPFLSQVRGQIAYALNEQHEIGVWVAVRTNTASAVGGGTPLAFRAVDQFTLFYHHRFAYFGDGVTWIGIPDHTKLGGNGSLGAYTFGGTLTAPLSPRFGAFTSMQYMAPSARSGAAASIEESFYITLGISFYPYANSRYRNVAGDCWMPYMPVATDGTFLVDTNHTF
jgi:hypothetical protein